MTEIIGIFSLEIISLIVMILIILSIIKSANKSNNRVDYAILVLAFSLLISIITRVLDIIQIHINFTIGKGLTFEHIVGIIAITFPIEFIFYLRQYKKVYLLPVCISIYIIVGIYLYCATIAFIVYAFTSIIFSLYLIYLGKKNRNGVVFMLGIALVINGLFARKGDIFTTIMSLVSLILWYSGSSGFIDKYLLIDKTEKLKLQNVWISKVIIKEKKERKLNVKNV